MLRSLWNSFRLFGFGELRRFDQIAYYIDGVIYWWIGGFGAQLESYEMSKPISDKRVINNREYKIFSCQKSWLMYRTSWSTSLPIDINQANKKLRTIKTELNGL